MRVHWIQHAEHEGLGCIAPWLAARGHSARCTRAQRGEPMPAPADYDWLIVMGGPMNIYEHAAHPWLVAEKQAIRQALDAGKRILGICLGAQLLADQLGGPVVKNAEPEIGWHPVQLTEQGKVSPLLKGFDRPFNPFHWHGDRIVLPSGMATLASSAACAEQLFAPQPHVVGTQFHLEVTAADARGWFATERPTPSRYVQTAEHILAQLPAFADNNRLMFQLLTALEASGI
jgi:GMP synthase-like glutamine amidotransferase